LNGNKKCFCLAVLQALRLGVFLFHTQALRTRRRKKVSKQILEPLYLEISSKKFENINMKK
jgi:hypothetical protein